MIEFEDERVCFTAIDARMFRKKFRDEGTVSSLITAACFGSSSVMLLGMRDIVTPAIKRKACLAIGTPFTIRATVEFFYRE